MTLGQISNTLAAIVATIPATRYMRASDLDANIEVDHVDLNDLSVVLFNNLPEIKNVVSQSGAVTREWPIEIKVLQLAELDHNTPQSDVIRDACLAIADEIWDKVGVNQDLPDAFEYGINFLNDVKIYGKTMTGCTLTFLLNVQRTSYKC